MSVLQMPRGVRDYCANLARPAPAGLGSYEGAMLTGYSTDAAGDAVLTAAGRAEMSSSQGTAKWDYGLIWTMRALDTIAFDRLILGG